MRRQVRWVVAAAAVMTIVVPLAPAARAERQPGGGCSGSFALATVGDMAEVTYPFVVDRQTYPTVEAWAAFVDQTVDLNRDGRVCYKVGKHPNHGHFDAHRITHIDNTFRP